MKDLPNTIFQGELGVLNDAATGPAWTLTAVGDMAPSETFQRYGGGVSPEVLAAAVEPLVRADLKLANLEVGLADDDSPLPSGVCAPREAFFRMHEALPFDLYSLANNHCCDAGREAFVKTLELFDSMGIGYVAGGRNQPEAETWRVRDVKGVSVGVAAFAQDEHQVARAGEPGTAWLTETRVRETASAMAVACDVPIMMLHEGFEFMDVPRSDFRQLCRDVIDADVRVVIAHHPHVPQGIERWGNGIILYGVGNFFFTQPHFAPYPEARRSFVPRLHFRGESLYAMELQPVVIDIEPLATHAADAAEATMILEHLKELSAILTDDEALSARREAFMRKTLLPEFFGWIRALGNERNGDFSVLIKDFQSRETVHKLFHDFLDLYARSSALLEDDDSVQIKICRSHGPRGGAIRHS